MDLVQVVPDPLLTEELAIEGVADLQAAKEYLQGIIDRVSGDVEAHVVTGRVGDTLVGAVDRWSITDVVMTTHGRTGVSRHTCRRCPA